MFKNKKNKFENLNYLELTPIANYTYEKKDSGLINVLVPRFTDKFLGKYLQPRLKNKYIKANLDDIGTATWLLINGNNKVHQIANDLNEQFGEKIHPVNERLTQFLTQLYQAGFITFTEIKKG
ncbi:MAG TPA: PqqD family protein [Candidatus Kapabacteria bacterium]|nr:PqqD family protein [Candidatus Kapabacteria bacterium]HPO63934.1 PqqD family protein [Candidatus Kapabacteria bacterium]